jgi:nucleoside transporter
MPPFVRTRLSAMMFLFYFSLGSWAVTSGTYLKSAPSAGLDGGLGFSNSQVGWVYSTFALGGLVAMPLVGLLVDRLFRAERVFGIVNLICSGFLIAAWWWCERNRQTPATPEGANPEVFWPLFGIMLGYSFFLQLGLPLCTVLSLRTLADPQHQFARTRMWGTVGWVVAGLLLALILNPQSAEPFVLAGVVAAVAGVYGFTLPATRPMGGGKTLGEAFGLPALGLFRDRSFVVFMVVALVLSVMNQFYGVHGHRFLTERGLNHPERWMVIGQVVEVICMFIIPLLNPKQNMKLLMLFGAIGGAIRGPALAWGADWVVIAIGVPMHGLHFAFYFVVAATFIDREAPPHLRASAQAIAAFVSGGVGPLVGNYLAATVLDVGKVGSQLDWVAFWMWPLVVCSLASVAFLVWFRTPTVAVSIPNPAVPSAQSFKPTPDADPVAKSIG